MTAIDDLLSADSPIDKLAEHLVDQHHQLMRRLRQQRIDSGLTVEQVAERVGATPQQIDKFEAYDADPTLAEIRHYALAIGVRITHVVTDAGTEPVREP